MAFWILTVLLGLIVLYGANSFANVMLNSE